MKPNLICEAKIYNGSTWETAELDSTYSGSVYMAAEVMFSEIAKRDMKEAKELLILLQEKYEWYKRNS